MSDQRIAIVSGASSGIGAAMAALLAPRARVLILVARRKARLDELAAALNGQGADIEVRPADLADPSARAGLIAGVLCQGAPRLRGAIQRQRGRPGRA